MLTGSLLSTYRVAEAGLGGSLAGEVAAIWVGAMWVVSFGFAGGVGEGAVCAVAAELKSTTVAPRIEINFFMNFRIK